MKQTVMQNMILTGIYIHMKLSNYEIWHFLINIEMRFPVFSSSLDFNNYLSQKHYTLKPDVTGLW